MVVGSPDATVMLPSSSNLSTTISTTINCPQQDQQNNTSPASKPRNLSLSVFAPGAVLKGSLSSTATATAVFFGVHLVATVTHRRVCIAAAEHDEA
ncbi:unnamed protein product [Sphagnum troendelagicum]|uniref:Uncharacterized protein n=1 Tax=Sphagnum troendelagicum TaxID=128251 RepID=A0ABP0UWD8_9BRYO